MPIMIQNAEYYSVTEIADLVGVSRQTIWRWCKSDKIPPGHRFRDNRLLFSSSELDEIKRFATQLEPNTVDGRDQMNLF
mgnify:CR=1 FL=1